MREYRKKMRENDPVRYRALLDRKNSKRNALRLTKPQDNVAHNKARRDRYHSDPEYRAKHCSPKMRERRRNQMREKRSLVLDHYGRVCKCCGETQVKFLTIDHINNDGAEHRRKIGRGNVNTWLVNNYFPEGFRTLCFNCNMGRAINGGVCPHEGMN